MDASKYKIDLKIGTNPWEDVSDIVSYKNAEHKEVFMNSNKKYTPDTVDFSLIETLDELNDPLSPRYNNSYIERIKNIGEQLIDVRVRDENKLYFYGPLEEKQLIRIEPEYKRIRLKSKDFVMSLNKPLTEDLKFINNSLAQIATGICNNVSTHPTRFPLKMQQQIKEEFFVLRKLDEKKDSVLDILDNFLYEYGFVLRGIYEGLGYYISAGSYRDRGDVPSINITKDDIHVGSINYKKGEKKEVKLFKTNYKIIKKPNKPLVLYANLIRERTKIPVGNFWPLNGDSVIQYQEHTVLHKDNIPKSPDDITYLNNDLNWGTITKDSEVIWSENHTIFYVHDAGNRPFTYLREHYPKKSRILIAPQGSETTHHTIEYRVIGDTLVTGIPPGCSERQSGDRDDSGLPTSLQNYYGKWTPTRFYYTSEWFSTKIEATARAEVSGGQRRCLGRPVYYFVPIFEERQVRRPCCDSYIRDFFIRGDAWVSTGEGTVFSGYLGSGDSLQFEIKKITVEDTLENDPGDSTADPGYSRNQFIKQINYHFFPEDIRGVQNIEGYYMFSENGTLVKIDEFIPLGDTTKFEKKPNETFTVRSDGVIEVKVPGLPHEPRQIIKTYETGIAKFKWVEGLYEPNWVQRTVVYGTAPQQTYVTQDPYPLYDKPRNKNNDIGSGTRVIFFKTNQQIEEEVIETSFLYNNRDASDFVQGLLNDSSVDNAEFSYRGFTEEFYPSIIHPGIGSFVNVNLPEWDIHNERFLVVSYERNLDSVEGKTARIELKRVRRFFDGQIYPDIKKIFPDATFSQWDPDEVIDRIYAYTATNGVKPEQRPLNSWKYKKPGIRRNLKWNSEQIDLKNQRNREITS